MACAILFGLHVFVVCFYESMRNLNSLSVIGIEIAGAITFLTAFLMHADTIPGAAEQYPWFMGAAALCQSSAHSAQSRARLLRLLRARLAAVRGSRHLCSERPGHWAPASNKSRRFHPRL